MRTTLNLDDDVVAGAEQLRREEHIGLGEAVNRLARAGLRVQGRRPQRFHQRTARLGLKVDVSNVADALEVLDGPAHP